jgi:hypothetical protein
MPRGRKPQPPLPRFMAKIQIDEESGCWNWTGHVNYAGYGFFRTDGQTRGPAHRRGWELLRGPLSPDQHLDHLCRNRRCVNPSHLEPVSCGENVRRGIRGALTTHCPLGHPYDEQNTRVDRRGRRACRECQRASFRAWYHERGGAQAQRARRDRNQAQRACTAELSSPTHDPSIAG